jgi:hypothetical protein
VQDVKNMRPHFLPKQVLLNLLLKLHETKSIEAMAGLQSKKVQTMKSTEAGDRGRQSKRSPKKRNFGECQSLYQS